MPFLPELRETVKEFAAGFSDAGALESKGFYPPVGSIGDGLIADQYRRQGFYSIADDWDGGSTRNNTGQVVNRRTMLTISTFFACNKMVSDGYGFIPVTVMQKAAGANDVTEIYDHPMASLWNNGNDLFGGMDLRSTWQGHVNVGGACFGAIERRRGTGVAMDIHPLLPRNVQVLRERVTKAGGGRLQYDVTQAGQSNQTFYVTPGKPQDIFHVRGISDDFIRGMDVLHYARQSLGVALAQESNIGDFYRRGGRLPGTVTQPKRFTDPEYKIFRDHFNAALADPHQTVMLQTDMKYETSGLTMEQMQLLGARAWSVPEICRFFGISPTLVGDMSKANYNSVYVLAKHFAIFCISFIAKRWSQTFWRCVLTPEERAKGYYLHHNLAEFMRGDFSERWAAYATMLQNGAYTINEIRTMDGSEPSDDPAADELRTQQQNVPIGQAIVTKPNSPADADPDATQ